MFIHGGVVLPVLDLEYTMRLRGGLIFMVIRIKKDFCATIKEVLIKLLSSVALLQCTNESVLLYKYKKDLIKLCRKDIPKNMAILF